MANSAAFSQRFVFEHERASLLPVTFGAALIAARHCQTARWLENISAVRVMALYAVHSTFRYRMMLRQSEFAVDLQMALEASVRIFSRVDNELASSATCFDVLASWSMAGFAAALPCKLCALKMEPAMRTGRKHASDIGVTVVAGMIADIRRSGNFRGRDHRRRKRGTRDKQQHQAIDNERQNNGRRDPPALHT